MNSIIIYQHDSLPAADDDDDDVSRNVYLIIGDVIGQSSKWLLLGLTHLLDEKVNQQPKIGSMSLHFNAFVCTKAMFIFVHSVMLGILVLISSGLLWDSV